MRSSLVLPALLALLTGLSAGPAAAAGAGPAEAAAAVVQSFNAAVTARDLGKATGHFVKGGVQFNIRPAHSGLGGAPQGVTTELTAHWSTIGPVLFAATKAYTRRIEVLDARAEGDVATVWTRTRTETLRAEPSTPRRDEFLEIYLLVRTGGTWKIGAIADNRAPNDVGLGGGGKP